MKAFQVEEAYRLTVQRGDLKRGIKATDDPEVEMTMKLPGSRTFVVVPRPVALTVMVVHLMRVDAELAALGVEP